MEADESDPILGVVRAGTGVLLALALANGVFLYFFPSQAEAHYAWGIKPPVSAAFLGAGYLAGAAGTAVVVFGARRWRSVRGLVPGFCVLGVVLLAATVIHTDRFRWDYAPTWGWTVVYAALPVAAVYFWILQSRVSRPGPGRERDPRIGLLPAPSAVLGVLLAVGGIVLFAAPHGFIEDWPWPLTPLMARVFAGWYLLAATTLLFLAATVRRPHEVPIPFATIGVWSALILILPALYSQTVDTGAVGFVPWLVIHLAVLVNCGAWAVRCALVARTDY